MAFSLQHQDPSREAPGTPQGTGTFNLLDSLYISAPELVCKSAWAHRCQYSCTPEEKPRTFKWTELHWSKPYLLEPAVLYRYRIHTAFPVPTTLQVEVTKALREGQFQVMQQVGGTPWEQAKLGGKSCLPPAPLCPHFFPQAFLGPGPVREGGHCPKALKQYSGTSGPCGR